MPFPDQNQPIDLKNTLVDLAEYRIEDRVAGGKPDPIVINVIYAQEEQVYQNGRIVPVDKATYESYKTSQPNEIVNKFGPAYAPGTPLLLHRKLADVIIDTAIDMRDHYRQFTVVMDGLRTYDTGRYMEKQRPDLIDSRLLAPAGTSAHNRALAVDSKLFELTDPSLLDSEGRLAPDAAAQGVKGRSIPLHMLKETDELGHLDDLNMTTSSRFYKIDPSSPAHANRLNRLQAWQRASVKNKLPIANLLAEFWDDRVPGSPADMWRVLSCRAMCIGVEGDPKKNPVIGILKNNLATLEEEYKQGVFNRELYAQSAQVALATAWQQAFTLKQQQQLREVLGPGGEQAPETGDFLFHEWLETIHDRDLQKAGMAAQAAEPALQIRAGGVYVSPKTGRQLQ